MLAPSALLPFLRMHFSAQVSSWLSVCVHVMPSACAPNLSGTLLSWLTNLRRKATLKSYLQQARRQVRSLLIALTVFAFPARTHALPRPNMFSDPSGFLASTMQTHHGLQSVFGGFNSGILPRGTVSALAHVGTITYEACVGTTPFGCQLQNFAATQSNESWTSADGLQLRCSASHYVTIRATNCAGLQRTVASSATKLCCEPPVRGSAMLHDSSGLLLAYVGRSSASHANLSWGGFSDPCSGIREYTIALRAALTAGLDALERTIKEMQRTGAGIATVR